jgi:hypothetical protein
MYAFGYNPVLSLVVLNHRMNIDPKTSVFVNCPQMRMIVCGMVHPGTNTVTENMVEPPGYTQYRRMESGGSIIVTGDQTTAPPNPLLIFDSIAYITPARVQNTEHCTEFCRTMLMIAARLQQRQQPSSHTPLAITNDSGYQSLPMLPYEMWMQIIGLLKWYDVGRYAIP